MSGDIFINFMNKSRTLMFANEQLPFSHVGSEAQAWQKGRCKHYVYAKPHAAQNKMYCFSLCSAQVMSGHKSCWPTVLDQCNRLDRWLCGPKQYIHLEAIL